MNAAILKTVSAFVIASFAASAHAQGQQVVAVLAPVDHVYAPKGFDTNDETQVIVSGYLPNLCYKAPRSEAKVVGRTIEVTVSALLEEGTQYCPMMIVPFLETVSLGVLDRGEYEIVVNAGSSHESKSKIQVAESSSSAIDDHVYANVDQVEKLEQSRKVLLKGSNPSPCFVFDRVEFVSNGSDTFSVLPIMKQIREHCPMKMIPFTIETSIPAGLLQEKVLFHVRGMDGRSVNALVDNI
jgi:hypothetical protein